jgi:hypothetical protein
MTVFSSSSIFQPILKNIRFHNTDLKVFSGGNTLANIPLNMFKNPFEQYQRVQVEIPKGQTDFTVSSAMLGIKTNFLAIIPSYNSVDVTLNYLKWKFQPSADAKWSMTNILMLTGTASNPIPNILIDNPNPDCTVKLDILVGALSNDYLNDSGAFIYLNGLTYDDIHTFNEVASGILAFFNSNNELVTTVDITDIVNVSKPNGQNRVIIDESSDNNIVLDFVDEYNALQALSAINWVLLDPSTRALPTAVDTTPPVITYTSNVTAGNITIDMSDFPANFTKANFITQAIASVSDARDGVIVTVPSNITFKDINNVELVTIPEPGTYTAVICIYDLAGNAVTQTVTIDAQETVADNPNPQFVFNTNVINGVINPINILSYSSNFTANDAKVLAILNVTDDEDNFIPLSSVTVVFKNIYGTTVANITTEGTYTITFTAVDSDTNSTSVTLTMYANNSSVNSSPEIKFTSHVTLPALTATLSLASYLGTFSKTDAISRFITSVTDDVDGPITVLTSHVTITNSVPASITAITGTGVYTVTFAIPDSASNTTTKNITLTVTA